MSAHKSINPGRNGHHQLSDQQVLEIRALYESTRLEPGEDIRARRGSRWTYRKLAARFNCSRMSIYAAVNYETYEWVRE